jgi:L-threonylcarbamoyladenylate synthase
MNKEVEQVIKVFRDGGVLIFPTDTAFGIGCRMDDEKAVARVFDIKQRKRSEAVLVLVDGIKMTEKYVEIPKSVRTKLINKYWPGGLSVFFKTKSGKVPGIVTANSDILAVRWPKHEVMEKIIHEVGIPIIATSANRSGEKTPYKLEDLDEGVVEQVDAVLKGECADKKESTVIDTVVEPWKIIRQGAVEVNL